MTSGPKPLRAAIYARVSTRAQADKHGTAYQREALETYCERRGWTVVCRHVDEGFSGAKADRPGLNALWAAARRREIDVVVVWRFDRFARSLVNLVNALAEFEALGVGFVSLTEQMDTSTPLGRAMFAVAGAMAQLERDLARERVQAGIDAARARGICGGRPKADIDVGRLRRMVSEIGLRKACRVLGLSTSTAHRRLRPPASTTDAASRPNTPSPDPA